MKKTILSLFGLGLMNTTANASSPYYLDPCYGTQESRRIQPPSSAASLECGQARKKIQVPSSSQHCPPPNEFRDLLNYQLQMQKLYNQPILQILQGEYQDKGIACGIQPPRIAVPGTGKTTSKASVFGAGVVGEGGDGHHTGEVLPVENPEVWVCVGDA